MPTILAINNLLFPAYINELTFESYVFRRVSDYSDRATRLNHPYSYTDEVEFLAAFGSHQVTSEVTVPDPEPEAVLGWANPGASRLDDILLILSLLTNRHVWKDEPGVPINDHREYQYGHKLRGQLPSIMVDRGAMRLEVGFEPGINSILDLITEDRWQKLYQKGHYLLMANNAFRWQILETSFTLCWTIWEHVFALHNRNWLSNASLRRLPAKEKLNFVANHYGLDRYVQSFNEETISQLTTVRNQLVHVGKFPAGSLSPAHEFVELTEFLIAATLNLSNGTFSSVDEYRSNQGSAHNS